MAVLAFGEWAPDIAELNAGVLAVARNVYPGANSYRPVLGADAPYSDALPSAPRGCVMVRKQNGTFDAFAGTATKLYKLSATIWVEVGSGYALPADENWSFVQFGTVLLATNVTDGLQKFDVEAGSAFAPVVGAPKGRIVDVIEDYVVLASLNTDPFAIAWSDTNDAGTWSGGNSGGQTFADGGRVQNFAGAAGLVIQETTVRQMVHSPGSAVVFQFQKIEQAKGTVAPFSVIKFGPAVAYLAEDGFWYNGQPIGLNKINDYFHNLVDRTRLFSVFGTFDPIRPIFYWLFRTTSADVYDSGLMYNWNIDRWSALDVDLYMASNIATPGITLEQLAAIYPNIETVPYSLDSRVWQGGQPVFGVFGPDFKLAFFEGPTLEARIETGEQQLIEGQRAIVTAVRPLIDTASALVRVGKRERQADTRVWDAEASMQVSGVCRTRSGGRLHRFRVRVPAASVWSHTQGIDIDATPAGLR